MTLLEHYPVPRLPVLGVTVGQVALCSVQHDVAFDDSLFRRQAEKGFVYRVHVQAFSHAASLCLSNSHGKDLPICSLFSGEQSLISIRWQFCLSMPVQLRSPAPRDETVAQFCRNKRCRSFVCHMVTTCLPARAIFKGSEQAHVCQAGPEVFSKAPKKCIGGSGALANTELLHRQTIEDSFLLDILYRLGILWSAFFLTLTAFLWICLIRTVFASLPGKSSPLGIIIGWRCAWVPEGIVIPLQGIGATKPILDWSVKKDSAAKRNRRPASKLPTCRGGGVIFANLCAGIWGFCNLPQAFSSPVGDFVARSAWLICLSGFDGVDAMARPFEEIPPQIDVDNAGLQPSPLEATYSGSSHVHSPWPSEALHSSPDVIPLFQAAGSPRPTLGGEWLGVYLHTPFFRESAVAVRPGTDGNIHSVIVAIQENVGGVPHHLFSSIVPITPPKIKGYASFMRLPSVLRGSGGVDKAAIIVDLTRVGGNYFASYVQRRMAYWDFEESIKVHTAYSDHDLHFFIGNSSTPCTQGQDLVFWDGAVVTVAWFKDIYFYKGFVSSLFDEGTAWGSIREMLSPDPIHGTLTIFEGQRLFMAPYHQDGLGLATAALRRHRLRLCDVTTCSFSSVNLDHKGFAIDLVYFIIELPWPRPNSIHYERRDFFTFCDGRAVGVEPAVLHSHHPALHLPSIAAVLGINLPRMYRLAAVGGRCVGDEVFLGGHSSLILYAARVAPPSERGSITPPVSDGSDRESDLPAGSASGIEDPIRAAVEASDVEPQAWRQRKVLYTNQAEYIVDRSLDEEASTNDEGCDLVIGVLIFAPHYQTDFVAVHMREGDLAETIVQRFRGMPLRLPIEHLPCIASVRPLPIPGFAAFIVSSSTLPANDNVAVIVDLSGLGGHRFAAALPRSVTFSAWDRYIRALLPRGIHDPLLYIGESREPHIAGRDLCLENGTLIRLVDQDSEGTTLTTLEQLLRRPTQRRNPEDIPRPRRSGLCLLSGEDRWFLHARHYPGCSLSEAISRCLGALLAPQPTELPRCQKSVICVCMVKHAAVWHMPVTHHHPSRYRQREKLGTIVSFSLISDRLGADLSELTK